MPRLIVVRSANRKRKTIEKNTWLNDVIKLNWKYFTKEDKKTGKNRWNRYFELKKMGVTLKLPKSTKNNNKFGRTKRKPFNPVKAESKKLRKLGSFAYYQTLKTNRA